MNEKRRFDRPGRGSRPERSRDAAPVEEIEGQLEGRNALTEALRAGRPIDKVFIADGDTDKGLQRLAAQAKEAGAVIVPVDRRKLDQMSTFLAGSPAIHVITLDFVERLTATGKLELPWHRADKKVAYYENGNIITPEEPNAVKLEAFIFDALPLATRTMILEADRKECFAPTKNKTGVDSVESCREMLAARDARRLRLAGIQVPEGAVVELSPRDVFDDEDAANFFRNLVPTAYGR